MRLVVVIPIGRVFLLVHGLQGVIELLAQFPPLRGVFPFLERLGDGGDGILEGWIGFPLGDGRRVVPIVGGVPENLAALLVEADQLIRLGHHEDLVADDDGRGRALVRKGLHAPTFPPTTRCWLSPLRVET